MTAPDSRGSVLAQFADAVERLAFKMPAPNQWTPQFVQLAQTAKLALARGPQQAGGEDAEIREILFGALDRDRDNITARNLVVVAVNSLQRERERAETAEAALRLAHSHLDMPALRVSHCKDAAAIDAAIEQAAG